ncbi:MAG: sigma-70 family RNA polymerase sigma factor [Vicinamibacteria bacterium]
MTAPDTHGRFLALLDEHKGIVYKVASVYCRRPEDRPDLEQEILIQLFRSFGTFDGRSRFSTWMYRVAMNVAISFYRSDRRTTAPLVPMEGSGIEIVAAAEPPAEIRQLRIFISQLDELNRALILLYLEGHSQEEMAEVTGLTVTNVATKISRIKDKLRLAFAKAAEQENDHGTR